MLEGHDDPVPRRNGTDFETSTTPYFLVAEKACHQIAQALDCFTKEDVLSRKVDVKPEKPEDIPLLKFNKSASRWSKR